MLRTARMVIVDEIHAVIGTRRGAHLALSLERLEALTEGTLQRVGLSATSESNRRSRRYLIGTDRTECAIVDEGHRRKWILALEIPRSPIEAVMSHEVWEGATIA